MPDVLLMTMEHIIGNIIFEKIVDNQTINKVKSETLTKSSWLQAFYMYEWFMMYDKVIIVPNYKCMHVCSIQLLMCGYLGANMFSNFLYEASW